MDISKNEIETGDAEDLFRVVFKEYKSIKHSVPRNGGRKGVRELEDTTAARITAKLEVNGLVRNGILTQRPLHLEGKCRCHLNFGLTPSDTWKVYDFTFPQGLVFIQNPFTPAGQRYWMKRTIVDLPKKPNISNIDNLERKEGIRIKDEMTDDEFYRKLRWVTFGYHHDWDTKVYSDNSKSEFPRDLASLTQYISQVLGFSEFKAEAAIANYYHLDSTLSGHVDKSEANMTAPLFSLSFGQSAVFLIGGPTKSVKPQAVLLQSGDIVVMSGESRLSYHGVPKILKSSSESWNCDATLLDAECDTQESKRIKLQTFCDSHANSGWTGISSEFIANPQWDDFLSNYASHSRINLNIRQVLYPGQSQLPDSTLIKP